MSYIYMLLWVAYKVLFIFIRGYKMEYTINDLKRCLIMKLKKKYKDDEGTLIAMLEDVLITDYNKQYDDCLFNTFVFIVKESKDKQTIGYFINDLLRSLE